MKKDTLLPTIQTSLVLFSALLLPIFFVPFTSDPFDFNKRILLFGVSLLGLFLGSLHIFWHKALHFTRTPWSLAVTWIAISSLITVLIFSPNRISALLGAGGMYLAFFVIYTVSTSLIKREFTEKLLYVLSFSAVIVTLVSILEKLGTKFPFILTPRFFITGSPLFSVFFLGLVLLLLAVRIYQNRHHPKTLLQVVLVAICLLGILVNGQALLPGQPTNPQFLSFLNSWNIETDILKTPLNAIFGVGSESYQNAYSIFRPLHINQTPLWFVRFSNARNLFLEVLATHGIFGALPWILILVTTLRLLKTAHGKHLILGVGTVFIEILFLFFPPNVLMLGLLCLFLVAWSSALKEQHLHIHEDQLVRGVPAIIFSLIFLVATVAGGYGITRAYIGEIYYNRSLISASQGQGKETYDLAVKAIYANPFAESYHRAFALTNLSLAQAIAKNKELNSEQKQTIVTLIQQAIEQAKIATSLDPLNTANWDALTSVYVPLIGTVDGAADWAIASYTETIKTDPANPQVRFSLASTYRQIGNNTMALKLFEQAAQLKPDFANAYFNMADIYKTQGDKQNELAMLQTTLQFTKPEQDGYADVKRRVEELQASLTKTP